jgi:signal transduction histidine kinase
MVAIGTLVAGVSHEINTPIGISLTGVTHLEDELRHLKEAYEDETMDEDEFNTFLEHSDKINQSVKSSIKKARDLVKNFKKVAIDQEDESEKFIAIKEHVDDTILSLHNMLKKTKHTIDVKVDDGLVIYIAPGILSQIITNLIMNSLIHGFKGIQKGEITISIKEQEDNIVICYSDNGVGMSEEVKEHVFEPFFTTNRENGGSGLGMNILYNLIMKNLNGTMKIESSLGEGVLFEAVFARRK